MEITCKQQKEDVYPQLKCSTKTGAVILFSTETQGTVLYEGRGNLPVGVHSNNFRGENYSSFTGEVTLKN